MIYIVSSNNVIKINERSGAIQNADGSAVVEVANSQSFDSAILLFPLQKFSFSDTDIYLRCYQADSSAEVRVVPFIIDGGGSSSHFTFADDSAVDSLLDDLLPTITGA